MDYTSLIETAIVPIVVALIAAGASMFAVVHSNKKNANKIREEGEKFRAENTLQHNENKAIVHESKTLLSHLSSQVAGIDSKVDRLDERLDNVHTWQSEHEIMHLNENMRRQEDF